MLLSIIIPYFKTWNLTKKLLDELTKQQTSEIEIIVVDDGCNETKLDVYKNCKIIHLKENKGLSYARNLGINTAKGKFITFVDSDDFVSRDYCSTIIDKIKQTDFDYCYFGWRAMNYDLVVTFDNYKKSKPPQWNLAVWNAVYRREYVELFDEKMRHYEDIPWQQKMRAKDGKKEIIENKILYLYNNGRTDSLSDLENRGMI